MKIEATAGDIVLLARKGKNADWVSKLQNFFTKQPYTHCAIVLGEIKGVTSVLSADVMTICEPLDRYLSEESTSIKIYRPLLISNKTKNDNILKRLYTGYSGKLYGFAQLVWFVYRWFMESFGVNVKKYKNPFSSGVICSELVFYYLLEMVKVFPFMELSAKLEKWNMDTVHPGDIHTICEDLPHLFSLIYEK